MYEDFYGLRAKPFQLTPDPDYMYASKLHTRAISYLQYGLSQKEGFIVITGEIGTGKTTIANSLLNDLGDDVRGVQIVTPRLSPEEIVSFIATKLGLRVDRMTKSEILAEIEAFLITTDKQNKRVLLIVDEAQNLPVETIEELRMLSNFQFEGRALFQTFLLGQPELKQTLAQPNMEQFRQRIVASCHLSGLSESECQQYIEFRLGKAGYTKEQLFDEAALTAIFEFTRGVPRRINTLVDRVLLFGFLEEHNQLHEEDVNAVIQEFSDEGIQGAGDNQLISATQGNKSPNPDCEFYSELADVLDDAIKHKVRLLRKLEQAIKHKKAEYAQLHEAMRNHEDE